MTQPRSDREDEAAIQVFVNAVIAAGQLEEELKRMDASPAVADYRADWMRGLLLAAQGEKPAAAEALRNALEKRPNDPHLIRSYARQLEEAGQEALAVEQYRRLLALEPQRRREDYPRIVELELRQQHLDAAQQAVEQLARLAQDDPAVLQLQAAIAQRSGTPAQHLATLQQAVQNAPRDLPLRRQLVDAYREAGQVEPALEEALRCLQLADSLAEKLSVQAWILDWAVEPAQREWLLAKLRQMQQREADAYELGRCVAELLRQLDRRDEALQQLENLQRLRPTDVELLRAIVDAAESARQLPTAVRYQQLLLRHDRSSTERERLARLLRQAGRRKRRWRSGTSCCSRICPRTNCSRSWMACCSVRTCSRRSGLSNGVWPDLLTTGSSAIAPPCSTWH